jgi:hypothetical protein
MFHITPSHTTAPASESRGELRRLIHLFAAGELDAAFPVEGGQVVGRHPRGLDEAGDVLGQQPVHPAGRAADELVGRGAEEHRGRLAEVLEAEHALGRVAHLEDHAGDVVGERPQAGFALAQGLFGLALLAAVAGFAQLPLDGRDQAVELVLAEVVVGAGAHRGDRLVFLHHAGDDDEGQVEGQVLQQRSAAWALKPGRLWSHRIRSQCSADSASCISASDITWR